MAGTALVIDAVRTPVGRGRSDGVLSGVHPVDLVAGVLEALVTGLAGCGIPAREQGREHRPARGPGGRLADLRSRG